MAAERQNRPVLGIGLMVAAVGLLATMDMLVKVLVTADHSVFQMMFLRSWIILIFCLAVLPRWGGFAALRMQRPSLLLLRSVAGAGGALLYFESLRQLPLADATSLAFGATFIMTVLSVPLLKERVGPHRWLAVIVGFIGVLIVVRPGGSFHPAALLAVAGSIGYALMMVLGRVLGPTEPSFRQVFYFNLLLGLISLPSAVADWTPLSSTDLLLLGVLSVLAFAGHFCLTAAFVRAPIGVVAPLEYTALAWATGLGYAVWGDVPDAAVLGGSAIIVLCGLYILHRESRQSAGQGASDTTV